MYISNKGEVIKMKIKMYNASNWEVFHNDLHLSINTSSDYVNSELYDDIKEVYNDFTSIIEEKTGNLTEEEIKIDCNICFSSRF